MNAYVESVLVNNEVVKIDVDKEFREMVLKDIEAQPLTIEEIENVSDMERKIYSYLKNQGLEITYSDMKYSTSLVNDVSYKAINLEKHLLTSEKSLERLFSLSHELGHFLDCKFNHRNDAVLFQNNYSENCVIMEIVAWAYGWKVLESLGCEKEASFVKLAVECLNSYMKNFGKAIDAILCMNEIAEVHENECKEKYDFLEVVCL